MKFFKRLFGGFKKKSFGGFLDLGGRFSGLFGSNENKELINRYNGWIYRCVDTISSEVSAVPLNLYDGDKKLNDNHRLNQLLNNPNPLQSRTDLLKATQSFLSLCGDAFWYLGRNVNGKGEVREIWPLRPDWVNILVDADGNIVGYKYGPNRKKQDLAVDSVIPFINFNPKFFDERNPYRGVGDVEASLATLYEDEYIREWNKNILKNGGRIDGVLEYDGDMEEDDKKALEDRWNQKFSGAGNTGKTAILTAGLKYNKISYDHTNLDFILQKKLNRDDIFLMLGLPKGLLISDDVNRANAQASLYPFLRFTIRPKVIKIEETINRLLIPKIKDSLNFKYKFDNPVPEDLEAKLNMYEKAHNKWMTTNEIREKEGMKKIKDGDKLYVPFNVVELGIEADNEDKNNEEDEEKKDFVIKIVQKSVYEELSKKEQKEIDNLVLTGDKFEKKFKKKLNDFFGKMEKEALKLISEEEKAFKGWSDTFEKLKDFTVQYQLIFKPIYKSIVDIFGNEAMDNLNLGDNLKFQHTERLKKYLDKMVKKAGDSITNKSVEVLSKKMAEKIDEGASLNEIRETVKDYFVFSNTKRADRIARTETFRTLNKAKIEAWIQSGVVAQKKWVTIKDELTCPYCASMDGKVVDVEKNYFNKDDVLMVGDKELNFGYTAVDGGSLHVNCRCSVVAILKD